MIYVAFVAEPTAQPPPYRSTAHPRVRVWKVGLQTLPRLEPITINHPWNPETTHLYFIVPPYTALQAPMPNTHLGFRLSCSEQPKVSCNFACSAMQFLVVRFVLSVCKSSTLQSTTIYTAVYRLTQLTTSIFLQRLNFFSRKTKAFFSKRYQSFSFAGLVPGKKQRTCNF